jgi:hypothetical protein
MKPRDLAAVPWPVWAGLGVAAFVLINRATSGKVAEAIGGAIVGGVIDTATGAAEGVTYAVGDAVGIPRTNVDQCGADLAAGRYWDASFSCPAGTFIGGVWRGITAPDEPPEPVTWGGEGRSRSW